MTTDIHSCSLYCDRPGCIKAQRDELRAQVETLHKHVPNLRVIDWPERDDDEPQTKLVRETLANHNAAVEALRGAVGFVPPVQEYRK